MSMQSKSVLVKTEKGREVVAKRLPEVSMRLRQLLILVDGKRTVADLSQMAQTMGQPEGLQALWAAGLVQPLDGSAPIPTATWATVPMPLTTMADDGGLTVEEVHLDLPLDEPPLIQAPTTALAQAHANPMVAEVQQPEIHSPPTSAVDEVPDAGTIPAQNGAELSGGSALPLPIFKERVIRYLESELGHSADLVIAQLRQVRNVRELQPVMVRVNDNLRYFKGASAAAAFEEALGRYMPRPTVYSVP